MDGRDTEADFFALLDLLDAVVSALELFF